MVACSIPLKGKRILKWENLQRQEWQVYVPLTAPGPKRIKVMREIHENLYVGPQAAYEGEVAGQDGWWVVHANKEPYHRDAVQYTGHDPPTDHPEYLIARRGHRLMLNLIDAVVEVDYPKVIFDTAIAFVHEGLQSGARVLIHCEQGVSRSASIGLLYLRRYTDTFATLSYPDAGKKFSLIYPPFGPGKAIRYFLVSHWHEYPPLP